MLCMAELQNFISRFFNDSALNLSCPGRGQTVNNESYLPYWYYHSEKAIQALGCGEK